MNWFTAFFVASLLIFSAYVFTVERAAARDAHCEVCVHPGNRELDLKIDLAQCRIDAENAAGYNAGAFQLQLTPGLSTSRRMGNLTVKCTVGAYARFANCMVEVNKNGN